MRRCSVEVVEGTCTCKASCKVVVVMESDRLDEECKEGGGEDGEEGGDEEEGEDGEEGGDVEEGEGGDEEEGGDGGMGGREVEAMGTCKAS